MKSTGVCIWNTETGSHEYWLIVNKVPNKTRKMLSPDNNDLHIIDYKSLPFNNLKSYEKERVKTHNVMRVIDAINLILIPLGRLSRCCQFQCEVIIEAIAFQANGVIDQLSGLNYMIRNSAIDCFGIESLYVIPPTSIKAKSVGDGGANKDMMIDAWLDVEPNMRKYVGNVKLDDLADAYFMSHFPLDGEK